MSYIIFAAILWAVLFALGTMLVHKKYGSYRRPDFLHLCSPLGVTCTLFVVMVLLVVRVLT